MTRVGVRVSRLEKKVVLGDFCQCPGVITISWANEDPGRDRDEVCPRCGKEILFVQLRWPDSENIDQYRGVSLREGRSEAGAKADARLATILQGGRWPGSDTQQRK